MKERVITPRIIRVDLTIDDDDQVAACLYCRYKTSPWSCGIFGELPDAKRHPQCEEAESRYLSEHY